MSDQHSSDHAVIPAAEPEAGGSGVAQANAPAPAPAPAAASSAPAPVVATSISVQPSAVSVEKSSAEASPAVASSAAASSAAESGAVAPTVAVDVAHQHLVVPNVELRYKDLSYSIMLTKEQSSRHVENVFNKYLDLVMLPVNLVKAVARVAKGEGLGPPKTEYKILSQLDGRIRPGTMTLVISPPGHGKSCYLKALSNLLPRGSAIQGQVTYNGLTAQEAQQQGIYMGHMVQYVDQLDQHLAFLTVRETFEFIHENATVNPADCGYPHLAEQYKNRVDDVINLLHLKNCQNTVVGNDLLRGVSGGEKKRVTVGEALLTNARVLLMDEISNGLDAAVTFDIMHSLRERVVANHMSVVAVLLQPTPEVYNLFDDIVLLREGQVVYHGPREAVPHYFHDLGFDIPLPSASKALPSATSASPPQPVRKLSDEQGNKTDIADTLSTLLFAPYKYSPAQPRVDGKTPPLSTEAMVSAWKSHELYSNMMKDEGGHHKLTLEGDFAKAQYGNPFPHSALHHTQLLLRRQFLLMARNKIFLFMRMFSAIFMAIVFGGMYYQKGVGDALPRFGLFLNTLMNLSFANMSSLVADVENKFIAYKHVANNAHPSFSYVLAGILSHIPIAICETLLFCTILYWMSGLASDGARFFFYVLCGLLANLFMGNCFRIFAYWGPNLQVAQSGPLPIISLMVVFAGFMITYNKMGWMTFIHYIDIYGWLFRALAQNEFSDPSFGAKPSGPNGPTVGDIYLSMFEIFTDQVWKWAAVGYAFLAIFVVCAAAFATFVIIRHDRNVGSARRVGDPSMDAENFLAPPSSPKEVAVAIENAPAAANAASNNKVDARSVLPFEPMTVVFEDIKYTVDLPPHLGGGQKQLLYGISGYAQPGRMIALMGASGAGKTTLLDVLSSRKNSGRMEGRILLNGFPKEEESFSRITAYVEQFDLHMPLTTVREALQFSASLRLPPDVTFEQREAFIDEVLGLLELKEIEDRKVGDVGTADGLAPGERKRLTIAVELVSNAPVIFLDEPTTGLDARSAAVVIRTVKKVAQTGRTIICTIHQPSSELFFMFDDLLLLQKGGYLVYFGALGHKCSQLIDYVSHLPGSRPCPAGMNPASYMLDILAGTDSTVGSSKSSSQADEPVAAAVAVAVAVAVAADEDSSVGEVAPLAETESHMQDGSKLQEAFNSSLNGVESAKRRAEFSSPRANSQPVRFASKQARSWAFQFSMLIERTWRSYQRNVALNYGRLVALLGLNLLFGVIYYKLEDNDVAGISSKVACIFMTAAFAGIINMNACIPLLVKNRAVFYREQASYMYDSTTYALSNFIVEVPWLAFIILVTLPVLYFMLGLNASADVFFFHYICSFVLALSYIGLGQSVASGFPTFESAQAFAGAMAPLTFLFGGLFSPIKTMAWGARWVTYLDPVAYVFRAIMPAHFYCEGPSCPKILQPTINGFVSRDKYAYVEDTYDFRYSERWANFGYTLLFIGFFVLLTIYNTKFRRFIVR